MSTAVALVLHGADASEREYFLRRDKDYPQIVDEREVRRLAMAYCDGWHLSAVKYLEKDVRFGSPAWHYAMGAIGAMPYSTLRDCLVGDCNVAPILAARVALLLTRSRA